MEKDELKDINGKKSMKRLWANRLIWFGVVMNFVYFLAWIHSYFTDKVLPNYPTEMIYSLLGSGLLAIGITVFEPQKNVTKD